MDDNKCRCGAKGVEEHSCPYTMDIDNECYLPEDKQTKCNCCDECAYQCAMDI